MDKPLKCELRCPNCGNFELIDYGAFATCESCQFTIENGVITNENGVITKKKKEGFKIYFRDLNDQAKEKVLEYAMIESPQDLNWDKIPLAVIDMDFS